MEYDILFYKMYAHLEYITEIWYTLWSFGMIFLFWNVWPKKNLATLIGMTVGGKSTLKSKIRKSRKDRDRKKSES
jgi:hypothetical protein